MKLVPCIAWVRRGIPAATPQKVKIPKEELKQLLQGASAISAESSETDDGDQSTSGNHNQPSGLRGSKLRKEKAEDSDEDSDEDDQETDPDKRYGLDKYDEEKEESTGNRHLKGLAVFGSNEDDPYVANQDSDEDDEDFKLRPDDNLLLLGRVMEDEYGLEVYVYNESEESFYIHHDYPLECPPICVEPINYDPGNEREGGNICAVGGLSSIVQLWDLDLVESLEPVGILGNYEEETKKKKKKKSKAAKASGDDDGETSTEPKKKKKKAISHTEAVLDLSWNRHMPHILASCSADSNVILWDIDSGQGSNVLSNHTDKVQAVKWHPVEDNLLLSGGCDGLLNLWDCRQCTSQRQWSVPTGEVEKVQWNVWDPFHFFATSDTGDVYCVDSRQEAIIDTNRMEKAHKDAVSGIALHPTAKNCLATCGVEGVVKIWRVEPGGEKPLRLVTKKKLKLGKLFSCAFCPDNPWLLAVGGESEDGVYLWDIRKDDEVSQEFGISTTNGGSRERNTEDNDQVEKDDD